jgi:putative ABC transport system permease protein
MLRNYIKIAWRILVKHKTSALINISGLTIGMAVAILIGLWVWDELSYNKSFKNYDHIAQVMTHETFDGKSETSINQVRPLEFEFREKYGSSFKHIVMAFRAGDHILSYGEQKLSRTGQFMQAGAPDMFSLEIIEGTKDGLRDPASIIISSSTAESLFGKTTALNKAIRIDNRMDVKITGVYKDLPYNTEFADLKFIAPWDLLMANGEPWMAEARDDWGEHSFLMYVQISPNTTFESVSQRVKNSVYDNVDAEHKKFQPRIFLNSMNRWHLYSKWENGENVGGRIQFVWLFGIIGVFVLLLACINFMNLGTARSEKRAKEVGVRKAMGCKRSELIKQFLSESFLVVLLSFVFALLLVVFCLPWFNELADKNISMIWDNAWLWLSSLAFIVLTSLVSGSYPAFYLSSFDAEKVFKGSFRAGRFASLPRRVLVVLQFTVSIILIIGTIIVFRQIQHAKNRPIGYSSERLINIRVKSPDLKKKFEALSAELKSNGVAVETALSSSPLTGISSSNSDFEWKGKNPNKVEEFGVIWVSHDYGKTIGWQFKDGRDFSRKFASDVTDMDSEPSQPMNIIVNEAAAKYMNMKNPVGEIVKWEHITFRVVGLVKDMVMESPYTPTKQTLYFVNTDRAKEWIYIKLNPKASTGDALSKLEASFKKLVPSVPFEYEFADEEYGRKFEAEERIGTLASVFASIAIFISCLGLLGLVSFVAEQRSKEISIRKVLGATILSLWSLLSKEFLVLVSISCLLAFPVSWYFLHQWLQGYAYRTEISWWVFAVAGGFGVSIALLTVSFQAVKAAVANPIKNLRTV